MNNELDRTWEEVNLASFEVMAKDLPVGTEENH